MRTWHSYIGGFIGFFLGIQTGSILLALIGASIGSGIGRTIAGLSGAQQSGFRGTGFQGHPGGFSASQQSSRIFFNSIFSMIGKLAVADGGIGAEEREVISRFMRSDMRLDPSSQQAAMDIFNAAARSGESFESYARQFQQAFAGNAQFSELVLDILFRVASADGKFHPEEEKLIQQACTIFGYSQTSYDRLKNRYMAGGGSSSSSYGSAGQTSSFSSASYSILGCTPSDSDEVVRKAYRQKVNEFHPDKIAAKGLPEEFTEFAKGRFQEIQNAWDSIRKERAL